MRKGLGGLGTLLVLGLGLGILRSSPGPSIKPASKQRAAQEVAFRAPVPGSSKSKPYCVEKDLLGTIQDFLPESPVSVDDLCASYDPLEQKFKSLLAQSGNEINFALAIVPDPVHTHLSLFFDRTMDAIQQGAQQAGWIFDRATMPWDGKEHPESTDFRVRLQQDDYQGGKEDLPGLMIFRRAYPDQRHMNSSIFVLVVGETPTGGINKKEFRTAVKLIKILAEGKVPADKNPLRIIGPTFSGSLYSLAGLLKHEVPSGSFDGVVIRSGTVSSWKTAQEFDNEWLDGKLRVDFATFQQSDEYMLRKFVEFEKRRGYTPDRIAVLAEDETAYGNRERPPTSSSAVASKPIPCLKWSHAADAAKVEATLEEDENSVLQLYFPRDISHLRSAYQQGRQSQSPAPTDSYQVRSTLPLNLQDSGSDDDSVEQYAHSQTPLSQESILLGIIAAIREHHIQFVVLQATNPIDMVFLSRFLKQGYSQARVVAMPADLLLSRDADDVSLLHGVMALTTYSLLPGIDDEVAIPHSLPKTRAGHIFPSAYAAGTYNATISQILCIESPSDAGCSGADSATGLPVAHYAEYGWPSLGGRPEKAPPFAPVVWLTVLGRDGFWPVAILEDGSYAAGDVCSSPRAIVPVEPRVPSREFKPPRPPLFWKMACGIVVVMAVLYWLLLWRGSILASSAPMRLLAPVKDPSRSALIAVVGWLLLAAILLLVWPCAAWLAWRLGPALWVGAAAMAAGFHCWVCVNQLDRRGSKRASRVFIRVAAVMVVCFVLLYVVPGHSQNAFLYRYIHLTSGVSPLLPLLCLLAGGLWWAWFSLTGLELVDKRRPRLPGDGDLADDGSSDHIAPNIMRGIWPSEDAVKKLVNVVQPFAWDPRVYFPVFMFLFIFLFALDRHHPLLSLETGHFEWVYAMALGMVSIVLFATLFRLLAVWLECRKILTTIDRFPLRRAFAELNYSWQPIWRLGGSKEADSSRLVSRELETLGQLQREAQEGTEKKDAKPLLEDIVTTLAARNKIRKDFAAFSRAHDLEDPSFSEFCVTCYEHLEENIARTCGAALNYLQPKWWGKEGLILQEAGSKDEEKNITVVCCKDQKQDKEDETGPSQCTRLAERFVALVYLNFILSVLLRMRTLAMAALGLYIFLLLSVNFYPFEPRVALRSTAIFLLLFIVGIVGYVAAQVHRDSILSMVTQTKPGELGVEFWLRMGTFVALPLISLLVSQFPTLNNALFSWLEPAVSALK